MTHVTYNWTVSHFTIENNMQNKSLLMKEIMTSWFSVVMKNATKDRDLSLKF